MLNFEIPCANYVGSNCYSVRTKEDLNGHTYLEGENLFSALRRLFIYQFESLNENHPPSFLSSTALGPEKAPSPDKAPSPEKAPSPDKAPSPEREPRVTPSDEQVQRTSPLEERTET